MAGMTGGPRSVLLTPSAALGNEVMTVLTSRLPPPSGEQPLGFLWWRELPVRKLLLPVGGTLVWSQRRQVQILLLTVTLDESLCLRVLGYMDPEVPSGCIFYEMTAQKVYTDVSQDFVTSA